MIWLDICVSNYSIIKLQNFYTTTVIHLYDYYWAAKDVDIDLL